MKNDKESWFDIVKSDTTSYKYIKEIGSGGFGDVYLVQKENTNDQ